jgi:hypothetical protein
MCVPIGGPSQKHEGRKQESITYSSQTRQSLARRRRSPRSLETPSGRPTSSRWVSRAQILPTTPPPCQSSKPQRPAVAAQPAVARGGWQREGSNTRWRRTINGSSPRDGILLPMIFSMTLHLCSEQTSTAFLVLHVRRSSQDSITSTGAPSRSRVNRL